MAPTLVKTGIKYRVVLCNNTKKITKDDDFNFDVIILAISPTPNETKDIMEWIKNSQNNTPIIAIANHNNEEEKNQAITYGCTAYVEKPINGTQLLQTIADNTNF